MNKLIATICNFRNSCSSMKLISLEDREKDADLDHMFGYQYGPVFPSVLNAAQNNSAEFMEAARATYKRGDIAIDDERAIACCHLINSMTKTELSELTHAFDIWASQEARINNGEKNVRLEQEDFSELDHKRIQILQATYMSDVFRNGQILAIDDCRFVISNRDAKRLTNEHRGILKRIAAMSSRKCANPIYVELDEDGSIIFD